MNLSIKRSYIELLMEEARKVYPIEACGLLFGQMSLTKAVIEKVVLAPNMLLSSERFEINPETVAKSILESEKEGLHFVGLFHSHPAPATPSLIDANFMKFWGDAIWLILSSTEDKIAAFRMKDGELEEVRLEAE